MNWSQKLLNIILFINIYTNNMFLIQIQLAKQKRFVQSDQTKCRHMFI